MDIRRLMFRHQGVVEKNRHTYRMWCIALGSWHLVDFVLNSRTTRGPIVPLELQIKILDPVVNTLERDGFRALGDQIAILKCILVCQAWKAYIERFWLVDVCIKAYNCFNNIQKWRQFLKNNPAKAGHIKSVSLERYGSSPSYSALLLTQKLQGLQSLYLDGWNMIEESTWIYRATFCMPSLNHLHLQNLKGCTVEQLIKFINSIHHLSKLSISFVSSDEKLKTRQLLPRPCTIHKLSLCLKAIR